MKLNLRDPLYWLIILTLAGFIGYQIHSAKKEQNNRLSDNLWFNHVIEQKRGEIRKADSVIRALDSLANVRRAKDSLALNTLKTRNSNLSRKLADLRPEIQVIADTVPQLRRYLAVNDSLHQVKESTITHLELSHRAEIIDLSAIIDLKTKQILNERAVSELLTDRNATLEKDLAKSQRGKRVRNYVIAGLISVVLYQLATK